MNNPYMTVEIVERDSVRGRTKIKVWHPDVLHYKSTVVSNATHEMISKIPRQSLEKDSKLFAKMNMILMKDM